VEPLQREVFDMKTITSSQLLAGALFSLCFAAVPANATVDHTYVSGEGSDNGACTSPATACRHFAYALEQTSAYGDIIVIDPADYGPVTITQSINIVAQGKGPSGITVGTGNAITISAGATDVVSLSGLTLNGDMTAPYGIMLNSAGTLTISDCVIQNFQSAGIFLHATATTLNASILNSVMNNDGAGVQIFGAGVTETFVTVRNSVAINNAVTGFYVRGATLTLAGTMATGSFNAAIFLGAGTASQVLSYGDNELNGNATAITGGSLTLVAKQ
jgi:hypothetical protein